MSDGREYWLIAAPADRTREQTWEKLQSRTASLGLSVNYKFDIPELKVGTLDALVSLSDELGKHSAFVEGIVKKIATLMADLLEDQKEKLDSNLTANGGDLERYLTTFQWDVSKYPLKSSIQELTDAIVKEVSAIDGELKGKVQAYNNVKNNLQAVERKATGNLLVRSLHELVTKDMFVESEYLQTVLVVVPKTLYKDWQNSYERLAGMVVPRSSKLVTEEADYGLYSVTIFQRVYDEFKNNAREKKFVVRDFKYDDAEVESSKKEKGNLEKELKKQWTSIVRWAKTQFSEAFQALIHLRALRVFVESVLRYGLPVNFQAALLLPKKGNDKKVREALLQLYGHLDGGASKPVKGSAADVEIPGLLGQQDYLPFVCYKVSLNLVD
eukprot:Opistho-1_new@98440